MSEQQKNEYKIGRIEDAWEEVGLGPIDKARFNILGVRRARVAARFLAVLPLPELEAWVGTELLGLPGGGLDGITPSKLNDLLEKERQAREIAEQQELKLNEEALSISYDQRKTLRKQIKELKVLCEVRQNQIDQLREKVKEHHEEVCELRTRVRSYECASERYQKLRESCGRVRKMSHDLEHTSRTLMADMRHADEILKPRARENKD